MGLELNAQLIEYLRAIGWAITASIGFSIGVSIAVFIFNKLSKDIDEWQEIKNGNSSAYMDTGPLLRKEHPIKIPLKTAFFMEFPVS